MSTKSFGAISTQVKPKTKQKTKIKKLTTAIVYCEANFGKLDGKTANGLVRHSEKYNILSIIDSEKAGLDAGMVLDNTPNGIPVLASLTDAVMHQKKRPDYFIFGMAPASGTLTAKERTLVFQAIDLGINIVSGLHEFLSDDPEFVAASKLNNVTLTDIRKTKPLKDLRMYTGEIKNVKCRCIAVLGTDCAIGKRTTATLLTKALNRYGVKTVMVGTGQTGLIQGARYGVALDAVPSQFCSGELEGKVIEAYENEKPDVIIIEGQSALSHPAFSIPSIILKGSLPDGVVLQHAPKRVYRCDFNKMPMPTPESEIHLIEAVSEAKVIGLTLNHEEMTDDEVSTAIRHYEQTLGIPVTDALTRPEQKLVEMVLLAFPELAQTLVPLNQ